MFSAPLKMLVYNCSCVTKVRNELFKVDFKYVVQFQNNVYLLRLCTDSDIEFLLKDKVKSQNQSKLKYLLLPHSQLVWLKVKSRFFF